MADSSLAWKGRSRSFASGLKPPVWPLARLKTRWKLLLEWVKIGWSSTLGWRRYTSVGVRTGPSGEEIVFDQRWLMCGYEGVEYLHWCPGDHLNGSGAMII